VEVIMDKTVSTVNGPIPVDELGMTLMHEHLQVDWTRSRGTRDEDESSGSPSARVDASMAWLLRDDPHLCADNSRLDDPMVMAQELNRFVEAGGRTVVECTPPGVGRDPIVLREIARMSGVNVVMGSGWYVHGSHDEWTRTASVDDLCARRCSRSSPTGSTAPGSGRAFSARSGCRPSSRRPSGGACGPRRGRRCGSASR
jgi:phosphotriesterase-related protein